MARGELDQLYPSVAEQGASADEQRIGPLPRERGKNCSA
jgi:hypothetical protein